MRMLLILFFIMSSAFADYECRGKDITVEISETSKDRAEVLVYHNGKRSIVVNGSKQTLFNIQYAGNASGDANYIKVVIGTDSSVVLEKTYEDIKLKVSCKEI